MKMFYEKGKETVICRNHNFIIKHKINLFILKLYFSFDTVIHIQECIYFLF